MNRIRHIRRLPAALAGLAVALLAFAGAAPAALASGRPPRPPGWPPLPPGWYKHPPLPAQVRTVVIGGMPGWQIALIAIGAALLAVAAAAAAYRAGAIERRSHRHQPLDGGDLA
jgi:hypothetical protein